MKRRHLFALLPLILLVPKVDAAQPEIFTGLVEGVGAGGYDVVSYFTGTPLPGKAEFVTQWKGADWRFASAENLEAFKADPAKYAPQYGGYCAFGMAKGYAVKAEPEQWTITNGKLYLNYSAGVKQQWSADMAGFIAAADKNWPLVLE